MKRIEAIIRPERLGQVAALLASAGITGFTISDVRGHGHSPQASGEYRGHTFEMLVAHKLAISVYVDDAEVEAAVSAIAGGGATGSNSVFAQGLLDQTNTSKIYPSIPSTSTASNNYRLSLAYVDADTIIGNEGTSAKVTDFNGTTATVTGSISLGAAQRPLDYLVIRGVPYLAVVDTNSSLVSVYDVTNPLSRTLVASGSAVSGALTANANGAGQLAWGQATTTDGFWFTAPIYAMSTNQGIQALVFTVPEPSTYAMLATGAVASAGMVVRRRRRRMQSAA